jgi:hypothetical protein
MVVCNEEEAACLLRGMDWRFKYNSYYYRSTNNRLVVLERLFQEEETAVFKRETRKF